MRVALSLALLLPIAGCADLRLPWSDRTSDAGPEVPVVLAPGEDVPRPEARPGTEATGAPLNVIGQTAAALDRPSPAERAAAQAGAGQAGNFLGETLASLGAPGESGFWLVTGLVSERVSGRVEAAAGQSVGVELRPSGREPGAGSQISLSAMRALDLPLTALPTLRVFVAN